MGSGYQFYPLGIQGKRFLLFFETALRNTGDRDHIHSSPCCRQQPQSLSSLLKWSAQNPRWALRFTGVEGTINSSLLESINESSHFNFLEALPNC